MPPIPIAELSGGEPVRSDALLGVPDPCTTCSDRDTDQEHRATNHARADAELPATPHEATAHDWRTVAERARSLAEEHAAEAAALLADAEARTAAALQKVKSLRAAVQYLFQCVRLTGEDAARSTAAGHVIFREVMEATK